MNLDITYDMHGRLILSLHYLLLTFASEFPELWYVNYKTNFHAIHMGLGLRKSIGSYEVKLICGVGFMSYNSKTNYLDNNGLPCQNLADQVRIDGSSYDLDKLHSILDDTFEFDVDVYDSEIVRIGRNFNIYFSQIISFQLSRKFTDKFSVGLSAEITRAGVDTIDSIE